MSFVLKDSCEITTYFSDGGNNQRPTITLQNNNYTYSICVASLPFFSQFPYVSLFAFVLCHLLSITPGFVILVHSLRQLSHFSALVILSFFSRCCFCSFSFSCCSSLSILQPACCADLHLCPFQLLKHRH